MRERVEILSGHLEINSQPGQGTRIRVLFPLSEPALVPKQQRA
jgi:signal transduction histidine kinase